MKPAKPTARKRAAAARRQGRARGTRAKAFPIVGIGASAGGLDAFKQFFSTLPNESGLAFVLIQHLDPTRESLTADLVGTYTPMPVVQAEDGMRIDANHVYVIPPNAYLSVHHRILRLSTPTAPRSLRMAVDFFLCSLAEDQQESAIGIILSGTGTDGTLGLKEIKAGGGMTIVQDPQSAQHDGMPRSAIAAGDADYVLPPAQMGDALLAYVQHAAMAATSVAAIPDKAPEGLAAVVEVLRARTKFDFSGYKKGTLRRRIQRRMSLRQLSELPKYVEVLRNDPVEATALLKDLLINVTSFFREPAAWQVLQEKVIRGMVAASDPDVPLRVWIPACATGEEAYSIAMVLAEEIEAAGKACRLQIFASDVDADALEIARAGVYPEGIAAHVSPQRLSRFFTKDGHSYQINGALRDAIVFAQQSLIRDPPFSRLDLISCRNFLIYLEPALQADLIPLLHFALVEGGYLFLGSAEGIGSHENLFEPVSAKWRIYRRTGPTRHDRLRFPLPTTPPPTMAPGRTPRMSTPARLTTQAQSLLLQRYAPACIIVSRTGEILYYHGQTDDYLMQPTGVPTQDLLALARHGLRAKLRSALEDAIRGNQKVVLPGLHVRRGGAFPAVQITVEPFTAATAESDSLWLISFEDEPEITTTTPAAGPATAVHTALVQQLEYELASSKEDLQQTIEDLRAANEELMSVNEEFQSSNEELETSKEELQSLNEELTTANAQLESKIGELEAANNDLDNLLTSTNIATVFLDTELRIRRFTPAATQLFSLIPSDIGRPIGDITQKFTDPDLLQDAAAVLQRPMAPKTEVHAHDGRWYVRQVLPYRTRDDRTEGVVLTFSDVAAEALQEARLYAESIVDTVREPLLVLDGDLRVRSANQSFYASFRVAQADAVGHLLYELGDRQWDIPELRTLLGEVLPHERTLDGFELKVDFEAIGPRVLQLNARAMSRGGDRADLILLAIDDITERTHAQTALREAESRKQAEERVRQRQADLAHSQRLSTVGELASGLAHELNQPLSAIVNGVGACARYLRSGQATPPRLLELLEEVSDEALRASSIVEHLRHFIEKGKPQRERQELRQLVRNVLHLLDREIRDAQIEIDLDLPPEEVFVYVDAIQIEQIIVNLMQNAIEAIRDTRGADRRVRIHAWTAKGKAEVAVRDSGVGISAAATDRMFEPFFTTKSQGLGMGLAISRSIVEAHRGRIWVEPRADGFQGTTVRLTLPLLRSPGARRKKRGT